MQIEKTPQANAKTWSDSDELSENVPFLLSSIFSVSFKARGSDELEEIPYKWISCILGMILSKVGEIFLSLDSLRYQ